MNLYDLDTPAAIVDLDRLERNISRMAAMVRAGGKALRPHIKTHKCVEIARLQLAAGACGLTVAKLGEAEVFACAGCDNLFIANQVVGETKIERLMAVANRVRIAIGIDSEQAALPVSLAASSRGITIPVRIEVDSGAGRAGVRSTEEVVLLARAVVKMPGIEMEGLFTYEGGVSRASEAERPSACAAAAGKLRDAAAALRQAGIPVTELSAGSTPGAPHMSRESGLTELRPGTYVFYDAMQTGWANAGFPALDDCALTVLATVISRPDDRTAILDAGTKSLSGDRAIEGSRHGVILDDPAAIFDWANEEHGHVDLTNASIRPRIGDKLRIVPWHVCTCVNMHDLLYAVRGERVEAAWPVAARGRIQ